MCMSSPKMPAPPPPPAPPPEPAKPVDPAVKQARSDEQKRARQRQGTAGTILTGPRGLTDEANTTGGYGGKTLLGQ